MDKMKNGTLLLFLSGLVLVCSSCYYDNEEALYPGDCQPDQVSYSETVLPILQNNCFHCHDAQNKLGNVTLEGYGNLKVYVEDGRFLGALRRENGFSPMPQDGPKLDDCLIDQIAAWVADGAPDN
jgi:hypothetical protein